MAADLWAAVTTAAADARGKSSTLAVVEMLAMAWWEVAATELALREVARQLQGEYS